MPNHAIILFDGVCNLCNSSVQFIIKRDKRDYFRFAALQTYNAEKKLPENRKHLTNFNSIILIENEKYYFRSTAALRIARKLSGAWKLLYIFIIVPPFIRHFVYDIIARNRYRWFGRQENCMIPSAELKEKFIQP
jgi:predicted DCC family thiol-disulfide oxidoreductase YuxK